MADAWDEYIRQIQSGGTQQQPSSQGGVLGALFSALMSKGNPSGAGPGEVPVANKKGMYTPGLDMAAAGPSTPINYSAIRGLLNSGVMQSGKVPPMQMQPAPAPPTPTPPAASGGNPITSILSSLFGLGG